MKLLIILFVVGVAIAAEDPFNVNKDASTTTSTSDGVKELPGGVLVMEQNTQNTNNKLTTALTRIHAIATDQSIPLSTSPRETQLKIIRKLSKKLPWKLQDAVEEAEIDEILNELSKIPNNSVVPTTTKKPTPTPIHVSILDSSSESIKKYVQVKPVNKKNSSIIFELEHKRSNKNEDPNDLSSMEIEAMVKELETLENRPKERDYPDHPDHNKLNNVRMQAMQGDRFNHDCDYFTSDVCLLTQDYPIEAISQAIESNVSMAISLLPMEAASDVASSKLKSEGGFLCPSKVAYARVKKAKSSTSGKWKYVVNYGDRSQTLRMEKCLTPGSKCSYTLPQYKTSCTQVYSYHRLLAWDDVKGVHVDLFKIPTVCTCHVSGFYSNPFSHTPRQSPAVAAQRRHHTPAPLPIRRPMPLPRQPERQPEIEALLRDYESLRNKLIERRVINRDNDSPLLRRKRKNSQNHTPSGQTQSRRNKIRSLLLKLKQKRHLTSTQLVRVAKKLAKIR